MTFSRGSHWVWEACCKWLDSTGHSRAAINTRQMSGCLRRLPESRTDTLYSKNTLSLCSSALNTPGGREAENNAVSENLCDIVHSALALHAPGLNRREIKNSLHGLWTWRWRPWAWRRERKTFSQSKRNRSAVLGQYTLDMSVSALAEARGEEGSLWFRASAEGCSGPQTASHIQMKTLGSSCAEKCHWS